MVLHHIALNDLRQIFNDKKSLLFLVVMPIGFTAGLGFALRDVGESAFVAVRVLSTGDGGVVEGAVIDELRTRSELDLTVMPRTAESEADGRALVARGSISALILVPSALDERAPFAPLPRFTVVADTSDQEARAALAVVDAAIAGVDVAAFAARTALHPSPPAAEADTPAHQVASASDDAFTRVFMDAIRASRAMPSAALEVTPLYASGTAAPPSGFGQASPGLLVQFAIMSLLFGAGVVFAERRAGVWRRLLAAPVRALEIVVGHGLAMFIVTIGQSLVLVVVGDLVFGVAYHAAPLGVALVIVGLAAWVTGLGMTIAVLAKREEHVILFALMSMFFFTGLGGAWVPLEMTAPVFARIGGILPSGLAMKGLQDVILRVQPVSSVFAPVLGLCMWTALFYAAAALFVRRRGGD
jgi:ABC-2 type transport system permease protein